VTADEALRDARGFAGANRVRIVKHARDRMDQRGAVYADVVHALVHAMSCCPGDRLGRWEITGPDTEGVSLTAVVVFDDKVIVITVTS
jgi:hypothetical protein